LSAVRPPHPQPAVRQGEDLTLTGHNLNLEGLLARFQHPQLDAVQELTPLEGGTAVQVMVHIPSQAEDADALDDWTPGFYTLSMILDQPVLPSWSSNSLAFALSPTIAISPVSTPAGDITLTVTCSPRLRTGQGVRLLFGESQIVPDSIVTPADTSQPTTLTFLIQDVDPGEYVVRLRVDGVDSLPFVRTPTGLEFAADQQVTVT
jgi:hypothetical protein